MSVSAVGLNQSQAAGVSNWRSSIRQSRQDFDQLYQALQTGNLSAAQQAYTAFQQDQAGATSSSTQSGGAATTASTGSGTSAVATDWTALGQALQAGGLESAQSAFGKLQQDALANIQQEMQNARSVYALMQGNQGTTGTSTATPTGALSTDISALSQALQSGDTTSAQKLLAQLEQDLQASGQSHGTHHHHRRHHEEVSSVNGSAASTAASTNSTSTTSATTATTATPAA